LSVRGSQQRWARAQSLVLRLRKHIFAVVWHALELEVKEGRFASLVLRFREKPVFLW
jgi:hypothetical protein